LISALVGGEWSVSHPGRFTSGERSPVPIRQEGMWVPELVLDKVEKRKFFTDVFSNRPCYMPSQTSPCTLLPSAYFPLVRSVNRARKSSKPMRVGAISFILPSNPYINGILAGWLFYSHTLVSCLADFQSWRWRWYVPLKCQFTYELLRRLFIN
jgi:hypothetical protein